MASKNNKDWMNETDDWYSETFERTIYVYVDGERVDEKEGVKKRQNTKKVQFATRN